MSYAKRFAFVVLVIIGIIFAIDRAMSQGSESGSSGGGSTIKVNNGATMPTANLATSANSGTDSGVTVSQSGANVTFKIPTPNLTGTSIKTLQDVADTLTPSKCLETSASGVVQSSAAACGSGTGGGTDVTLGGGSPLAAANFHSTAASGTASGVNVAAGTGSDIDITIPASSLSLTGKNIKELADVADTLNVNQCLHVNAGGIVSTTGSDCGSSAGGVASITGGGGPAVGGSVVAGGGLGLKNVTSGTTTLTTSFDYTGTFSGDYLLNPKECVLTTAGTSGGGFLCEGSGTADGNEQLHIFPPLNGADTTDTIMLSTGSPSSGGMIPISTAPNTVTYTATDSAGDVTLTNATTGKFEIGVEKITEPMLKTGAGVPTTGQCLTASATAGQFTWGPCGATSTNASALVDDIPACTGAAPYFRRDASDAAWTCDAGPGGSVTGIQGDTGGSTTAGTAVPKVAGGVAKGIVTQTSGVNVNVALRYSDTLVSSPGMNPQECEFSNSAVGATGTISGGGFICEGNGTSDASEQLYLFPSGNGADTTSTIVTGLTASVPTTFTITGTPNGTKYLRDDGVWSSPPGGTSSQYVTGDANTCIAIVPGMGQLCWDGSELYIDGNANHIREDTEVCITCAAADTTAGDVTIPGDLIVGGDFLPSGIPFPHEQTLTQFRTDATIPNAWDCWVPLGQDSMRVSAAAANPTPGNPGSQCRYNLMFDTHLTRFCGTIDDGTVPTSGTCQVILYKLGSSGTPLASITVGGTTAGEIDAVGDTICKTIDADVPQSSSPLYVSANASCSPGGSWPNVRFGIFGYGVTP